VRLSVLLFIKSRGLRRNRTLRQLLLISSVNAYAARDRLNDIDVG